MVIYFLWVLVVAGTNAHVLYRKTCDQARQKYYMRPLKRMTWHINHLLSIFISNSFVPRNIRTNIITNSTHNFLSFHPMLLQNRGPSYTPYSKLLQTGDTKTSVWNPMNWLNFWAIRSPNCATLQQRRSSPMFWMKNYTHMSLLSLGPHAITTYGLSTYWIHQL